MVNVNINAPIFVARYFLPKFKARFETSGKRSCVINVASIGGMRPYPGNSVYCGTKAFDRLFSLTMEKDCALYADVHTVLPMSVKSSLNPGILFGTITPE
jgi:NADP-dependent 3-hydroxy acid dehydrogenase YdfG